MSAVADLRQQTEAARTLLAAYQDVLGDDVQARADAVEGETDLHEAITAGVARIVEIGALQEATTAIMGRLSQRVKRLGEQEERIRAALLTAMEVGGLQSLETPLGTVARQRVGASLVITDEAQIPADFLIAQPPKIDRRKLLAALKSGDPAYADIPGASLSNGSMTIAVRLS
jgi:hypothetical protein